MKFSFEIHLDDNINLTDVTEPIKGILQKIIPLQKLFETFDLNECGIDELKKSIENLEMYLVNQFEINDNFINFSKDTESLSSKLDEIHSLFAKSFRRINRIT
ncbi:MAG: hypothetical protein ACRC0V_03865 [Fusobacteriaceae bacterium]